MEYAMRMHMLMHTYYAPVSAHFSTAVAAVLKPGLYRS